MTRPPHWGPSVRTPSGAIETPTSVAVVIRGSVLGRAGSPSASRGLPGSRRRDTATWDTIAPRQDQGAQVHTFRLAAYDSRSVPGTESSADLRISSSAWAM